MTQSLKEQTSESLIRTLERMGYPKEFGIVISDSLKTEKRITRMISYLIQFKPTSAEEIADEMLAINSEFDKYQSKIIAEHYNEKYNELLNTGLEELEEEDK